MTTLASAARFVLTRVPKHRGFPILITFLGKQGTRFRGGFRGSVSGEEGYLAASVFASQNGRSTLVPAGI